MLQHQNAYVVLFSALLLAFICHCSATQFTVGDSGGWVIPPYPTFYSNWSHSYVMRVGDSLEFDFDTKFYNLIQVSKYEYEHCTSMEPLKIFPSSPAIIPLKERGLLFFTCSISNYCFLGQKVAISIHGSAPKINPPTPSQAPNASSSVSPQSQPQPQPHAPASSPMVYNVPVPPPSPSSSSSNDGGDKSSAVAMLVFGRGFVVSMFGVLLGCWVMCKEV